jgi:hypothetical protein
MIKRGSRAGDVAAVGLRLRSPNKSPLLQRTSESTGTLPPSIWPRSAHGHADNHANVKTAARYAHLLDDEVSDTMGASPSPEKSPGQTENQVSAMAQVETQRALR